MSTRTWEFQTGNHKIEVKDKKENAKRFIYDVIHPVIKIHQYQKEITGTHGGESRTYTSMILFGAGTKLANQEKYESDAAAFFTALPAVITPADYPAIKEKSNAIFNEHCPVVDQRRSAEEITKQLIEFKAGEEARKAESKTFRDIYCLPDPVRIPEGQMAVCLQITFDDSHMQSDYYAPHRSIGCSMLLAHLPKAPKTETIARMILEQYPELNKHEWTWHVENYSGGHGNYLMSSWTGAMHKEQGYDGRKEVNTRYEINFNPFVRGEMHAYKDYPGVKPAALQTAASTQAVNGIVTISENEEKGGVEIRFAEKPDVSTLSKLKSNGWRWSRFSKCWYRKRTDSAISFAQDLAVNGG